jgi:hypothetical protein
MLNLVTPAPVVRRLPGYRRGPHVRGRAGQCRVFGLGRELIGTSVLILVDGLQVRVITEDGELLRELVLDPSRDYQPHGGSG